MIAHRYFWITCLAAVLLLAGPLFAVPVALPLNFEFSGGTPPEGPTPWVTVFFENGPSPGTVAITIDTSGLVDDEFIGVVYLNLTPDFEMASFTTTPGVKVGTFATPTITRSKDAYKADGDGYFDILIDFAQADADRFGAGEKYTFTVTGPATMTFMSFDAYSAPGGGHGPFLAAAHVQAIGSGGEDSGWIAPDGETPDPFPEPATILLLGVAAPMLLARRKAARR